MWTLVLVIVLIIFNFPFCSYAREWQNKLRELQTSKAAEALLASKRKDSSPTPIISITPSFSNSKSPKSSRTSPPRKQESPIKMDSNGALNLASSPSPTDFSPAMSSAMSLVASADTSHGQVSSPGGGRSPPNFTAGSRGGNGSSSFGVEICVVCGDRASGKKNYIKIWI